ncbi:MAG: helix-turn-helix transcriptional regulator [Peptostreptococcaceae bacterium]|nr:helix-turn-helix transcriptional regulator [Peptostreptococcaceae bacterium]
MNLTQQQLAEALSVNYTTINRWENGHSVPSKLAQKSFYDFCENNFIAASTFCKSCIKSFLLKSWLDIRKLQT